MRRLVEYRCSLCDFRSWLPHRWLVFIVSAIQHAIQHWNGARKCLRSVRTIRHLRGILNLRYLLEKEPLSPLGVRHLAAIREEVSVLRKLRATRLGTYRSKPSEVLEVPVLVDSVLALYHSRFEAKPIILMRRDRSEGRISLEACKMRELFITCS